MMMNRNTCYLILIGLSLVLAATRARAQLTFTTSWGKRSFNTIMEINDICKSPIDTLQFINDFVKMQITKLQQCQGESSSPPAMRGPTIIEGI